MVDIRLVDGAQIRQLREGTYTITTYVGEGVMVQGMGFGSSGYSRSQGQKTKRVAAVVGFLTMSALAIGVPLLSKPAVVVVQPKQEVLPTPIPMINVYMPVQRIPAGTQLSPVMFRVEGMSPVSLAALGGQPVKGEAELVGKYAKGLIMPGRPVMADQLMDAPDNQITRKIRPGYRAITIQVDNVSGIEGWGLPGTKVDVLWQSAADQGEQIVTTIVKNAQILSVAGKSENSPPPSSFAPVNGPGAAKGLPIPPNAQGGGAGISAGGNSNSTFTVTLLVTPDDGQKIFLASRSGDMSLMLRGDFETASDSVSQASVTSKRAMQGGEKKGDERVEGVAKARRSDGSVEEWSVIEGRVWRWDQAAGGTTWTR